MISLRISRHEHLYEQIDRKLIRSDHFPETPQTAARAVLDARVMLCTLSCLSVDRLQSIAHVVPPQVILVDEASQIEVGDLVPALHRFRGLLKKVVCVGDDQQRECLCLTPNLIINSLTRSPLNPGPLSDMISRGVPNLQ